MANGKTPVYSGLGARGGTSAAGQSYLETIKGAGESLAGAATGLLKAKMEISRREAEARSIIPEANFSEDQGTKSLFAADALEIENKINGFGTDAYDFSRLDDIARFNKDIASLTKELSEAETVYNETIANFKQLELDNDLFKKVGEDPNQAIATEIAGIGDVYNAKAGRESYDLTIGEAAVLRNGRFEKTADGKYILKDSQGNEIVILGGKNGRLYKHGTSVTKHDVDADNNNVSIPAFAQLYWLAHEDLDASLNFGTMIFKALSNEQDITVRCWLDYKLSDLTSKTYSFTDTSGSFILDVSKLDEQVLSDGRTIVRSLGSGIYKTSQSLLVGFYMDGIDYDMKLISGQITASKNGNPN